MARPLEAVATKPRVHRGFVVFKWLVYAILAVDVVLYARFGRATELLDTAAWFVLLLLFEWETGGWRLESRWRALLHGARGLACVAIAAAVAGYAFEGEWLDFANESVWLGVIALLELEVRLPPSAVRLHRLRRGLAGVLYLALVGFLLTWSAMALHEADASAALLDAWDALWWLVAFLVIELNVFGFAAQPRNRASGWRETPMAPTGWAKQEPASPSRWLRREPSRTDLRIRVHPRGSADRRAPQRSRTPVPGERDQPPDASKSAIS